MNFYSLKQFKYSLARPMRCIVLPQIIAGAIIIIFLTKKGAIIWGEAIIRGGVIISNNAHWKLCPKYIVFYYPLIKKWWHQINWTCMGFSSVSNLVPRLTFNRSISSETKHKSSGISFTGSDSTSTLQGEDNSKRRREGTGIVRGWR